MPRYILFSELPMFRVHWTLVRTTFTPVTVITVAPQLAKIECPQTLCPEWGRSTNISNYPAGKKRRASVSHQIIPHTLAHRSRTTLVSIYLPASIEEARAAEQQLDCDLPGMTPRTRKKKNAETIEPQPRRYPSADGTTHDNT